MLGEVPDAECRGCGKCHTAEKELLHHPLVLEQNTADASADHQYELYGTDEPCGAPDAATVFIAIYQYGDYDIIHCTQ